MYVYQTHWVRLTCLVLFGMGGGGRSWRPNVLGERDGTGGGGGAAEFSPLSPPVLAGDVGDWTQAGKTWFWLRLDCPIRRRGLHRGGREGAEFPLVNTVSSFSVSFSSRDDSSYKGDSSVIGVLNRLWDSCCWLLVSGVFTASMPESVLAVFISRFPSLGKVSLFSVLASGGVSGWYSSGSWHSVSNATNSVVFWEKKKIQKYNNNSTNVNLYLWAILQTLFCKKKSD